MLLPELTEDKMNDIRSNFITGTFNGLIFGGCWGTFYGPFT